MTDSASFRLERDALGDVPVPADALYGAQTARAAAWSFSPHRMPLAVVHALARVKACAATVHARNGRLPRPVAEAIERAALEVVEARHDEQFVVDLLQTGSGTSTNMNVNEVLARRAQQLLDEQGQPADVHPNDDVNRAQSSNDTVPAAMQLALVAAGEERLLPAIAAAVERLHRLAELHWHELRDGRTHLMRATPVRFGQQFRGYAEQLATAHERLRDALQRCGELPLGGTAVGTGVGCPDGFASECCAELRRRTGLPVREVDNHLQQGSLDAVTWLVAGVRSAATTLYKIANDLRWQASDARGELRLPAKQPGSSIMPGKVNPVVCEAVCMACARIVGHDATVAFANSQGQFELNTMIPVVADAALDAVELLASAVGALRRDALVGLEVERAAGERVSHNPILATGLNEAIGYDLASEVAKAAMASGRTVHEVARERTNLDDERLAELLDPARLCGGNGSQRSATSRAVAADDGTPEGRLPATIVASERLTDEQKVRALRELAYDARERLVAAEEGMAGPVGVDLAAIQRALRSLGVGDGVDGDTKQ